MVTVSQLMRRNLISVQPGTSVADAAKVMRERQIGSVFVRQSQRIVGIVTEPDIVRKVVGADLPARGLAVEEIMSSPVVGIEETRPITEAADLMEQHRTRHLAVMKSGVIIGILSVRDLLHPVSIDEF